MKLSICMIVKNEEENLPRLFQSIKKLLKFSELIIVDTGSTDKTVEIAKQYTDKIYHYQWDGSFANARNESIKYATGDYILILDADDEIATEDKLIDLVNSDDLYKQNTYFFSIKNVLPNNNYTVFKQARLFRRTKNFKYSGTIHNQPVMNQPIKSIDEIEINHYGYYDNNKVKEKMLNRTIPQLLKEIEQDKDNYRLYIQLAQSYTILHKYYLQFDAQKKQIEIHTTPKNAEDIIFVAYNYLITAFIQLNQLLQAYELLNKMLTIFPDNLDFLYNKYLIFTVINKNKAEKMLQKCIEAYKKNKNLYEALPYEIYSLQGIRRLANEQSNNRKHK